MIAKLKNAVTQLKEQPLDVIFTIVLALSVFLPLFITIPVILTAFLYFLRERKKCAAALHNRFLIPFLVLSVLLLITPLVYQNYYGFACGIAMIIYLTLEYFVNSTMTEKLFNVICDICCAMSIICFFAAVIERIISPQIRSVAFTYNANFYGYLVEMTILICFYKLISTKKLYYWLIIAANVGAIFLCDCRSAWTGLLAGLLALFIIAKKKKALIGLGSVTGLVALAIYLDRALFPRINDFGSTVLDRVNIWRMAFNDFLSHPVFGRGLLALYQVTGNPITPHAHNILLDFLECTGIVGTSIIIFYFVMVIKQLARSFKLGGSETKACIALCGAVIAATLAHGVTDMPIMGVHTGLFFVMLLALRPRVAEQAEADEAELGSILQISKPFRSKV